MASWALRKAPLKLSAMPMTSPVERISGPRMMSTPGNFANGKTDSFTATCLGTMSLSTPSSARVLPAMTFAATCASGSPMDLLTKGTVREARGLTSMT